MHKGYACARDISRFQHFTPKHEFAQHEATGVEVLLLYAVIIFVIKQSSSRKKWCAMGTKTLHIYLSVNMKVFKKDKRVLRQTDPWTLCPTRDL